MGESQSQQLLDCLIKQKPAKSDVIVWLQGDRLDRGRKVRELYQQGFAPLICVTGNNKLIGLGPRPGENDMPINEIQTWLRKQGVPYAAVIVDDQALNTWEQAVNTIRLARENDWQRLLLVTSPYHQVRAFLTFLKAMRAGGWKGKIINQPAVYLAWNKRPGGRDKRANELLADELIKIKRYKDHVASFADGLTYSATSMITLRPATMGDASRLLEWRNDPVIRQHSFQSEVITPAEHIAWLKKVLSDGRRHLFIILNEDGEAIGQARFDVDGDKAEINIGLNAEYRGKGYGVESIRHSSTWFLQQHPEIDQVFGRIKLANQTSIKAFTKAGYSQAKEVDQGIYMVYKKLRCGAKILITRK